jgi:large subunit ribosomal protein L4
MKLDTYTATGKKTEAIKAPKEIFDAPINEDLMKQAVRVYLSNQRMASAQSKTRSEVLYTGRKMYRQKGTGNARHSNKRAPIFVGGSKAHGPNAEQDFRLKFPKKMRQAALKSALSQQAKQKAIMAMTGLVDVKIPKTKEMVKAFESMKLPNRSILLVVTKDMTVAEKSVRNIAKINTLRVESLSTYHVLHAHTVIFTEQAIDQLTKRFETKKQ